MQALAKLHRGNANQFAQSSFDCVTRIAQKPSDFSSVMTVIYGGVVGKRVSAYPALTVLVGSQFRELLGGYSASVKARLGSLPGLHIGEGFCAKSLVVVLDVFLVTLLGFGARAVLGLFSISGTTPVSGSGSSLNDLFVGFVICLVASGFLSPLFRGVVSFPLVHKKFLKKSVANSSVKKGYQDGNTL